MICAICAALVVLAGAQRVDAQSGTRGPELPDDAQVRDAFAIGAQWMRQFGGLPRLDQDEARVPIEGATGICIIARVGGRVVGIGTDWTGDDLMLRRAMGRALGQVLGDDAASGENLSAPGDAGDVDRAAMQELIRAGLGERLTMEMEVSGALEPLLGRTFEQLARRLEPGLDGVALRAGERLALRFPAQMRANNSAGAVGRAAAALAFQMDLPRTEYEQLQRDHNAAAYRFRTRALIQDEPGGEPVARLRGDDVVALESVTMESIAAAADGIARHLFANVFPDDVPLGLMGDYRPVSDDHSPFLAPPVEQALCAWALSTYAAAPGVDEALAGQARQAAVQLLQELAVQTEVELDPLSGPVSCAAIVLAARSAGGALNHGAVRGMYDEALRIVLMSQDEGGVFHVPGEDGAAARPVSPHTQALMAYALVIAQAGGEESINIERLRAALDACWRAGQPVAMTPWLGWAELTWATSTGEPLRQVEALKQVVQVLQGSRLGADGQSIAPDLAGGLPLTEGSGKGATAQTARPAGLLAMLLRVEPVTPAQERSSAIVAHLETIRFLMQLTVREGLAGTLRNPPRAIGGIRAAPWDVNQPLAAQAMTLAALTETLSSLEALDWPGTAAGRGSGD